MKQSIRIASGQGFWGDLPRAPIDQARNGPIDYLVMDYLAEVTMSILQKQRLKDPAAGYARDFVEVVTELAPDIRERGFKVVSNAGGVNPVGCAQAIIEEAKKRAEDEAAKIVAAAKAEAEQQTVAARETLREQVAALAVKGAEQILRKEVNAGVHAELLTRLKTEL